MAETSRLDNPFKPGVPYKAPEVSASTIIKLWNGGEHANAKAMASLHEPNDKDMKAIRAACPGWDD